MKKSYGLGEVLLYSYKVVLMRVRNISNRGVT